MKKIFKMDWIVLICTLLLLSIGLFTLYSLTNTGIASRIEYFQKEFTNQLIYTVIGVLISVVLFSVPPIYFKFKPILAIIYIFTLGLLIYTIFFGLDVRGVRRWITIGSRVLDDGTIVGGFTIQASEFAKLSIIIITSALLSIPVFQTENVKAKLTRTKRFFFEHKILFITLLLNLGILIAVFAQKSLSVTTVTAFIIISIMFANAKHKLHTFVCTISFVIAVVLSQTIFFNISMYARLIMFGVVIGLYILSVYWEGMNDIAVFIAISLGLIFGAVILNFAWNNLIHDYQKERIEAFTNPDRSAKEEGFQQEQSKISIGAGQVFGQGFRQVSDARLLLLPEPTTDFIFAIFGFKFGFVGTVIIIGIYLTLICRLFYLADTMDDAFGSLVLIGVASMILVQFFSNIGMNADILPVGGTTLPLISAGGSSLMSMIIGLTICQNVIATNKMEKNVHQRKDKIMINGWNM
jgi:rod shape determining protein RodA